MTFVMCVAEAFSMASFAAYATLLPLFQKAWGLSNTEAGLIGGIAFHVLVGEFTGKAEQFIEGTIAMTAAAVLTWMIFWMRKNSRGLGAELRAQVDRAETHRALATIAFVAVLREGLETVLFLISAETASASGSVTTTTTVTQ